VPAGEEARGKSASPSSRSRPAAGTNARVAAKRRLPFGCPRAPGPTSARKSWSEPIERTSGGRAARAVLEEHRVDRREPERGRERGGGARALGDHRRTPALEESAQGLDLRGIGAVGLDPHEEVRFRRDRPAGPEVALEELGARAQRAAERLERLRRRERDARLAWAREEVEVRGEERLEAGEARARDVADHGRAAGAARDAQARPDGAVDGPVELERAGLERREPGGFEPVDDVGGEPARRRIDDLHAHAARARLPRRALDRAQQGLDLARDAAQVARQRLLGRGRVREEEVGVEAREALAQGRRHLRRRRARQG
jgi:hypothetical protein